MWVAYKSSFWFTGSISPVAVANVICSPWSNLFDSYLVVVSILSTSLQSHNIFCTHVFFVDHVTPYGIDCCLLLTASIIASILISAKYCSHILQKICHWGLCMFVLLEYPVTSPGV